VFDATFYQFSLHGRLGIAWEPLERLKIGATVTSPTLKLFGSGEVLARSTVTAFRFAQSAVLTGSSFQQDLGTNYKTPVSAALGIEFQATTNWALAVSVEYFGGLSQRSVIDVDTNQPFFRQVPASLIDTRSLRLLDEREPVVNVSAGTEYRLTNMYSAYAGFWTDFSPVNISHSKALLRSGAASPWDSRPWTSTTSSSGSRAGPPRP
jgi:long-subunit fatty acid transport protein